MADGMSFPIVFQALPKWDAPYNSTSLTVARLLSKKRKVFYVDHPFSWLDRYRSNTKQQRVHRSGKLFSQPFDEYPNFYVIHPPAIPPINSLEDGFIYQSLLKKYQKKLWKRIDWILDAFGIDKFGYVNSFDPVFFDFTSTHKCIFKGYHCVDLIKGETYIAKHGVQAEEEACKKADFVITTSDPLKEKLGIFNSNTVCIANASDFEHFSEKQEIPNEYKTINKTKLVYTGSLGHRIDYEMISSIADQNPDIELILIGPKHATYFGGQELEDKPNVRFLGPKNYDVLPAYIQYADVLLIPFLKNELTHHIYPLKLNEYLATGKPIVSTKFTDLSEFEGLLTISEDFDCPSAAIKSALNEDSLSYYNRRRNFASKNTWMQRMIMWEEVIKEQEMKSFIDID